MLKLALIALALTSCMSVTITGYIYADNYFEFYFNGQLVKTDPLTFTPHNGVKVSFEWDGISDKTYAFKCMDFATTSGYEYTSASNRDPQLGDGAFIVWFDDGTTTSTSWKTFVTSFGPSDASVSDGCSSSNLTPCAIDTTAEPTDW